MDRGESVDVVWEAEQGLIDGKLSRLDARQ